MLRQKKSEKREMRERERERENREIDRLIYKTRLFHERVGKQRVKKRVDYNREKIKNKRQRKT